MQIFDIDSASSVPIWRQIEDAVRRLVASGRLQPGAAILSVRELSRALRVNPATVSKAYQRLTEAGLLEVRRGEGTFVAGLGPNRLAAEREGLLADGAAAFVELARGLGAAREEALAAVENNWNNKPGGGQGKDQ